ncbi:MAG: hypothetical protein K2W82_11305 [Candidatus Obscuribacterales bacterium]|nr:hypothetical protein [Candidatus Obscuribacterales bacterium]
MSSKIVASCCGLISLPLLVYPLVAITTALANRTILLSIPLLAMFVAGMLGLKIARALWTATPGP